MICAMSEGGQPTNSRVKQMPSSNLLLRKSAGSILKGARATVRAVRAVGNITLERKARQLRRLVEPSQLVVSEADGYVAFTASELELERPVSELCRISSQWINESARNGGDKLFLINLLTSNDVLEIPEIMDVAMHPVFFGAATSYLQQVPKLVAMTVWLSPPNNTAVRSQLYHYDHKDTRQAKIFINLNDVTAECGPLHFIPATSCLKVEEKVGYSQGRYSDEEVYSAVSESEAIATVGKAGSGYLVDTARCLHYGSRGNLRERLVLMVNYARANCVDRGSGCEVLDPVRGRLIEQRYATDEARAFSLSLH